MAGTGLRFVGVELYFDEVEKAKTFYKDLLGLKVSEDSPGHFTKCNWSAGFVCLERKGSEDYPSHDKAVLFFESDDLEAAVASIGRERFLKVESAWAVLHDPSTWWPGQRLTPLRAQRFSHYNFFCNTHVVIAR